MDYLGAFLVGLVASTVSAISTGGALISIPGLILLGFNPATAIASSRLPAVTGSLSTIYRYNKSKLVPWVLLPALLVIAVIGGLIGPHLLLHINSTTLEPIVGIVLLLMLPLLLLNRKFGAEEHHVSRRVKTAGYIILLLIMIFATMFGVGGGTFLLYALIYFMGMKFTQANAAGQAMWLFGAATAFITYAISGAVNYDIAIPMSLGSLMGGYIGAHIAVKKGPAWIKLLLALVIIASSVKLIFFK